MTWARKITNWNTGIKKRGGTDLIPKEQNVFFPTECRYCKAHLDPRTASLDHMVPLKRGGEDNRTNYEIICYTCNRAKGTLDHEEYEVLILALYHMGEYAQELVLRKLRSAWRVR